MTQENNILQELKELGSSLATSSLSATYHAPAGYFDNLAGQIMLRIKALETREPGEELAILSPFVSKIGKGMPYNVPAGYFDGLEKKLLQSALNNEQTPEEELETLSPLLSGLKKQTPYSVPAGYFEQLNYIPAEQKLMHRSKLFQ